MILRRQTVRRLTILLAAVLVMVGIGWGLYLRNEHRKERRLADARATGLAAYKAGDYRTALESLKTYVSKRKNDVEALHGYGASRARIEQPNGKHIMEAIGVFNAILALEPDNLDAQHSLLDLYSQVHYSSEMVELADRVLALHPDDPKALRAKCVALDRLRQHDKALAVSERINALDPTDLDQQLITYELMRKLRRPPDAMLARAQQQQQARPDDPRFAMLLAMAYGTVGDVEAGKKWLSTAATRPAPDASFVRHMVRIFDSLKMYKESQALLDRVTAQNPDPLILRVLIRRMWQNNQHEKINNQLKKLDPASTDSDSVLLAYRALALNALRDQVEADRIVAALAERVADPEAVAWSMALTTRFSNADAKTAVTEYQAALTRSPDNPVIRSFVGEAYSRLGETELAIVAWRRAAELAPSWAMPRIEIARTLAAGGRIKEAVAEAEAAVRAAPGLPAAATTLAGIRYRVLEEGGANPTEQARLLSLVEQIQKLTGGEPETLPIYVDLLAREGRADDARKAARSAISDPKRRDPATLLRLQAIDRAHKLGLEQELAGAGSTEQETPRLALARAADLAATAKPQEGLALLQARARAATTQPVEWKLALTQYKELIRDRSAAAEWVELGENHPHSLSVQLAILKSAASARTDREFIARTIDRIKTLTGPEGQTWKLERARWLLGGDSGKDAAEAVNTLTEIVHTSPTLPEARVLLAIALENTGNVAGAAKELQAAAELEPNNAMLCMEVARLLQSQNQFADARTYLERAAATPDLAVDQRRRIAAMMIVQGDVSRAAKVLLSAGDNLDTAGQLLLADIHRRESRPAEAEAIYQRLLQAKPVDLETIRAAADFYAAQQKMDEAQSALARIPEANARPGAGELVRASFDERHVSLDAAARHYLAATLAAPRDTSVWRQLVAFQLRNGKYSDAAATADRGLDAAPQDAPLKRLRDGSAYLAQAAEQHPSLRPVLAILAAAPDDRGTVDFLTAPVDATTRPTVDAFLTRLKESVSRFPRSLPLQTALAQLHVALRQFDEAAKVAGRAMEAFPNDPDSARIAAAVYRAGGKLDLAAAAAQQWRQRTPENHQSADWMLAEIRLAQGDGSEAVSILKPYAERSIDDPKNRAMLMTLMRGYALLGREKEARSFLEPRLSSNAAARSMWLQLASRDIADADVAAEWVRQVTPLVPATATSERIALANAWYSLAIRGRVEGTLESAAQTLDQIIEQPTAPAEAVLLRAAIADRMGDPTLAETNYRRGLAQAPDHPEALNNLAYLILLRGGDPEEAMTFASRAVALGPDNASFLDTLARVQSRQGDREGAIASFRKALKLDPNNLEALIGLATAHTDAGQSDAAARLMPQIEALLKSRPSLSTPLRRELDALRASR